MREYTRAEVAFWSDPDPDEPIEPAAKLPQGNAYNFVLAGLAVAYGENAFRTDIGRDEDRADAIERAAMKMNWGRHAEDK